MAHVYVTPGAPVLTELQSSDVPACRFVRVAISEVSMDVCSKISVPELLAVTSAPIPAEISITALEPTSTPALLIVVDCAPAICCVQVFGAEPPKLFAPLAAVVRKNICPVLQLAG